MPVNVKPLSQEVRRYLTRRRLTEKFEKQAKLLQENVRYPSLRTELLKPSSERIYSFRIDKRYRAIFLFITDTEVEIVKITDHYQ